MDADNLTDIDLIGIWRLFLSSEIHQNCLTGAMLEAAESFIALSKAKKDFNN
jgi:hypothetical protein